MLLTLSRVVITLRALGYSSFEVPKAEVTKSRQETQTVIFLLFSFLHSATLTTSDTDFRGGKHSLHIRSWLREMQPPVLLPSHLLCVREEGRF